MPHNSFMYLETPVHFDINHLPTESKAFAIFFPPISPKTPPIAAPTKPPRRVPITGTTLPIPAPINAHLPIPINAFLIPPSAFPPKNPPRKPEILLTPQSELLIHPVTPSYIAHANPAINAPGPKNFIIVGPNNELNVVPIDANATLNPPNTVAPKVVINFLNPPFPNKLPSENLSVRNFSFNKSIKPENIPPLSFTISGCQSESTI